MEFLVSPFLYSAEFKEMSDFKREERDCKFTFISVEDENLNYYVVIVFDLILFFEVFVSIFQVHSHFLKCVFINR